VQAELGTVHSGGRSPHVHCKKPASFADTVLSGLNEGALYAAGAHFKDVVRVSFAVP
jgi:hypothetical protein